MDEKGSLISSPGFPFIWPFLVWRITLGLLYLIVLKEGLAYLWKLDSLDEFLSNTWLIILMGFLLGEFIQNSFF